MKHLKAIGLSAALAVAGLSIAHAQTSAVPASATSAQPAVVAAPAPDADIPAALRTEIARAVTGADEPMLADRTALAAFYESRNAEPLWVSAAGISDKGRALAAEIANAAAYGLERKLIALPALDGLTGAQSLATAEHGLSLAALTYARHARGGRIPDPAGMLNSNLDRKPQLHAPKAVLEKLAGADDVATALASLHPVHPQFERLRQKFLAASADGQGGGKLSTEAKRLRANMEFWRWMWDDLGQLYVFNNIPEFMQYVVHDGKVVRADRIVVGQLDKQSSVFSRPLKHVVLRPQWRVPESIMVHELWPSLLKGGGLMRQHGLEITTKTGEKRDWRSIDWSKDDIRNYHVWQQPGPKSAVGYVKFSFPSQHTIFMHDTPDKWMFNAHRRTLSHGCLRVRNPMQLAEIILDHDKGWDKERIRQLVKSGPLDNEVELEKKVPIHLAYFTAWVDDDGKLKTFADIYGHEKRVTQALDGDWKKIVKGRDHLAPPKPRFKPDQVARTGPAGTPRKGGGESAASIIGNALGFNF
jgi:murein L,D-transpeptidase YcbB/YkuD